jgi:tetratricopeptide (TPR) repeat protein
LGNVLVKLGQTADAIEQFRSALGADPRLVSALFNLGALYLEASEPQRAMPLLQRAAGLRPQDDEIRSKYILSLVRAGSPERIQKELEAAGSQTCSLGAGKELAARHLYIEALDQFRRERACQPDHIQPILGEATSLLALGRAREAIDAINARWDEARTQKHARWILGSAYERLGLYTEAFEHFASAVDLDPDDVRARMALGLLTLKAKTPQLSARVFEDAAARFPDSPEFKLGRALVAQATGDNNDAERRCRALLSSYPDYTPAIYFAVTLHLDAAQFDQALTVLSTIRSPASPLLARYLRAAIMFEQSQGRPSVDVRSAMRALETSLVPGTRFTDGHILLARYYRSVDTAAAEKHLRRALQIDPKSWQAHSILAQLYRKQGNNSVAQAATKQAEGARREVQHGQRLMWQLFYGESNPP